MNADLDLKKMIWHSRRGMLELDLLLVPFAERRLAGLEEDYRRFYGDLLSREDRDLYSWLVLKKRPPARSLRLIVDLILSGAREGSARSSTNG